MLYKQKRPAQLSGPFLFFTPVRFVVITNTPFLPLLPYFEMAFSPFITIIFSMLSGFRFWSFRLGIALPSKIISGLFLFFRGVGAQIVPPRLISAGTCGALAEELSSEERILLTIPSTEWLSGIIWVEIGVTACARVATGIRNMNSRLVAAA